MKICITSNTSWSIYNFRKNLIKTLVAQGHDVYVMSPDESYYKTIIANWKCKFITLKSVNPNSTNPFTNIKFYFELKKIFKQEKFDVIFSFTPKPNIWGAIASKQTNINFIPTVNGLGHAFINKNWLSFLVAKLYKYAFSNIENTIFQNPDDAEFFVNKKIVSSEKTLLVPGSGVDLEQFYPSYNINYNNSTLRFLFAGRFIKSKGIMEYVHASAILKKLYPEVSFYMVGAVSENPSSVTMKQIEKWITAGTIKYYALTDDMSAFLNDIDVLVFPSYYREGIPKILLEACAKELPIITTNNVGCNQVIQHEYNGLVVKEKDVEDLVASLEKMIEIGPMKRKQMGTNGRKLVEEKFDDKIVVEKYLNLLHFEQKTPGLKKPARKEAISTSTTSA